MLLNSAYAASKISPSQTDQRDVLFHVTCSVIKMQQKDNGGGGGREEHGYGASFLKELLHVLRDPAFQEVAGGLPVYGEQLIPLFALLIRAVYTFPLKLIIFIHKFLSSHFLSVLLAK